MKPQILIVLSLALALHANAGSATWNLNPTNGDWNTAANWTPATVPNGGDDTATFQLSSEPKVTFSSDVELDGMIFAASDARFTFQVAPAGRSLTFSGSGITNNSGHFQSFKLVGDTVAGPALLNFSQGATAGDGTIYSLTNADATFSNNASAGHSTITNGRNSTTTFDDTATAGQSTIKNRAGTARIARGVTIFVGTATAGNATITSDGDSRPGTPGGQTLFSGNSNAGSATLIANGGVTSGGLTIFNGSSSSGSAVLIATGGEEPVGSGGLIVFEPFATGDAATTVQLSGNGRLDISGAMTSAGGVAQIEIGSVEGEGLILLGKNRLLVGTNDLDSTYAGGIFDGGAFGGTSGTITKMGRGTLTLTDASYYTGGTTVAGGLLLLASNNRFESATGTGPVQVDAGTLGGTGNVSGAVTVGSGTGAGAFLAPGMMGPGTLTLKSILTLKADGSYICELGVHPQPNADQVIANGVTITSGAMLVLQTQGRATLTVGTSLTLVSNTATTPISGTFSNLADGGTISAGNNTFQANYEGGDGNDLTLTVVP